MRRRTEHVADARRREAVYRRWCADILRETRDRPSLTRAEGRALNASDVRVDPELARMIHGFVLEQEAMLTQMERQRSVVEPAGARAVRHNLSAAATAPARRAPDPEAVLDDLAHRFRDHLVHFEEAGAQSVLAKIRTLQQEHPDQVGPEEPQHYAEQLERLANRRRAFTKHIGDLHDRAVAAARTGAEEGATRALRRLSTIHAARPQLLSDDHFRRIREDIIHASEEREHRRAAQQLVARERAVAAEIKKLTDIVHRFHTAARRVPHDTKAYRQAKAEYESALREVRSHDNEWLAGLILELTDLLEEWHDPSAHARHQLDHFLDSVRSELSRLGEEIGTIETELHPPRTVQ